MHENSVIRISRLFPFLAVAATAFLVARPCQSDHELALVSPHLPENLNIWPGSADQSIHRNSLDALDQADKFFNFFAFKLENS